MSMPRSRILAGLCTGAVLLGVPACEQNPSRGAIPPGAAPSAVKPIGAALYEGTPLPKAEAPTPVGEPIVIPNAVVQSDVRVQLAAQVDGLIEIIGTQLPEGTKLDPNEPSLTYHPRDPKKAPYRRVRENDRVQEGQLLCRQDESLVATQILSNENILIEHGRAIEKTKEVAVSYEKQLEAMEAPGAAVSRFELLGLKATVAKLRADVIQIERERVKTEGELQTARVQVARFQIISPINGRVVKLLKSPREFAKAGDPIMEIQGTDRVRVEGKMDAHYASVVRRGMRVYVEPARPMGPNPHSNTHWAEVHCVGVTAHKGRPLVVSGGGDGLALVWDLHGTKQSHRLQHQLGGAVKALATSSGKDDRHLVATGGDDGKIRIWDVTTPDKLPGEAMIAFDDAHSSSVVALAFSPDSRFLASTDGREVHLWNLAEKKRLYSLPTEHRDAITMLRFTPQATLITASRDKSIRIWKLGTEGAAKESLLDHRSGLVDIVGVSSDGSRVLFDKDASRLDVVHLGNQQSIGILQGAGTGARFASLALFSPDDSLVLTAGGDVEQRGELTVWDAPKPGGRGIERRRLVTPRGAAITCAAFSPESDKPFIVVGTAEGGVHFWNIPSKDDARQIAGEVVAILPADAKSVQIRVEMKNPMDKWGDGLQDRSLATIIIPPDAPMVPQAPLIPEAPGRVAKTPGPDIIPASGISESGTVMTPAGKMPLVPISPLTPGQVPIAPTPSLGKTPLVQPVK